MGIGFIWPSVMAFGILFMRESPRWEYRKGHIESARRTIAISYGVPEDHPEVQREVKEIHDKLEAERAGGDVECRRTLKHGPHARRNFFS